MSFAHGGQSPYRQPPTGRPPRHRNTSTRNTWIAIGAVVLALCCCGGLGFIADGDQAGSGPGSTAAAATTTQPPDPRKAPIFAAEVKSVSGNRVTFTAHGREVSAQLARVTTFGVCGTEMREPFDTRLAILLPVAAQVTVVRAQPDEPYSAVFVHLGAAGDVSAPPTGPSVNEQLVAEGVATIDGARRDSATSYDEQVAAVRAQSAPVAAPYVDAIAAADTLAWENRVGPIADCRARLEREEQDKREKWGPDLVPGTDDDPERTAPTYTGGGGGGESRFCRKRWWC
ncbi:MAG TPA: hypothetical protein VK083_12500 [Nocardia sp.]|uniref:hypothetical protein n=1 Tax=Nocardia sp. TaxID=1821 RepID=UPI002B4B4F1C|nr:hypothetical protein [Nocardia sp.]HLS77601.1 hypothetical protein [Nocardia sp.]